MSVACTDMSVVCTNMPVVCTCMPVTCTDVFAVCTVPVGCRECGMAGFIVQTHTEAMAFQSLLNCTFPQQYRNVVYSLCLGAGPHLVQFTENLNLCAVNSVGGCSAVATARHTMLQYAAWRAALSAIVLGRRRCIITGYFSSQRMGRSYGELWRGIESY